MFQMLFDVHKITQLVKNFCYMGQRSFGIWTEVFSYNLLCERMCLYYVLVFILVGGIEMLNDHFENSKMDIDVKSKLYLNNNGMKDREDKKYRQRYKIWYVVWYEYIFSLQNKKHANIFYGLF